MSKPYGWEPLVCSPFGDATTLVNNRQETFACKTGAGAKKRPERGFPRGHGCNAIDLVGHGPGYDQQLNREQTYTNKRMLNFTGSSVQGKSFSL